MNHLEAIDMLSACDATGVRGMLTSLLGLFDADGSRQLSREEFFRNAKAMGYATSDAVWSTMCVRVGTTADAKRLDLSLIGDHFANKYDTLLEGILKQMLRSFERMEERRRSETEAMSSRLGALESAVAELSGGAERARRRNLESVVRRWQHGLLALCFDGWSKVVAGQKALLNRCGRHWCNALVSAAWRCWRVVVAETIRQRQAVANVVGRMRNRLAAAAFANWAELLQERRQKRETADRSLLRWQNQALAHTFVAWCELVATAREHRAVVARCLGRMRNREAAQAFIGWKEAVVLIVWQRAAVARAIAEQKSQTQRARQLAARMLYAMVGRCFDGWMKFIDWQRRIFRRAAYAIGPGRLLSMAIYSWIVMVREARAERDGNSFEARLKAGIHEGVDAYMAANFGSMDAMVATVQELEARVLEQAKQLQEQERARLAKRRQQLKSIVRRWSHKMLAICFDGWLGVATSAKQAKQKAIGAWRNQSLAQAWRVWLAMRKANHAAAQRRVEAREANEQSKAFLTRLRSLGMPWFQEMLRHADHGESLPPLPAASSSLVHSSAQQGTVLRLLDERYILKAPGERGAAQLDRDLKAVELRMAETEEHTSQRHQAVLRLLGHLCQDPSAALELRLRAAISSISEPAPPSREQQQEMEKIEALMEQAAGKRVTGHKAFLTLLSEWMRYFLIYRFGGLYIDFDMLVLRPLIVPGAMNRLGVDYQHLNYAVQTQQTEGGAAPHAHTGFSCIEGSGSNGKESDAFRDRRGRPFTCVCNCILLFERFHPLLERALNLSHPMLNYYVAHHSFGAMRHYGLMTRVLLRAAGGDLDWAVSTDIKGKGSVAPRKAIEKKMVSTFEQMDTYAFSCQDRSLRNRWLTPVASRAGAANAELIISHCHVYHTGWGGGDAAKVNGSEATLWEGSVGQQLRARMTTLPPKMDALAELPSQPQR